MIEKIVFIMGTMIKISPAYLENNAVFFLTNL